jgi:hypothetical protein
MSAEAPENRSRERTRLASGFRLQASGFGLRASGFRLQASGFGPEGVEQSLDATNGSLKPEA